MRLTSLDILLDRLDRVQKLTVTLEKLGFRVVERDGKAIANELFHQNQDGSVLFSFRGPIDVVASASEISDVWSFRKATMERLTWCQERLA